MKKKPITFLRFALVVGDAIAVIASFAFAYFFRIHIDPRPYMFESELEKFTISIIYLTPILLIINSAIGLYKKNIFMGKTRLPEISRVFFASLLGVSALITYDFFKDDGLFPVRVMAIYAAAIYFVILLLERLIIKLSARIIFRKSFASLRAVIIGNNKNTDYLASYISAFPESGYSLAGIVASKKYIPKDLKTRQYASLKDALKSSRPDVIFQTEEKNTEYVYKQALNHHALYYFVPNEADLASQLGDLELIGNTPAILVKTTPLSGSGAFLKRLFDIIFSIVAIVFALIPMGIIWLVIKLGDPKHSPIYSDQRLTRYNRKFKCLKFRSMKHEYSGMTAEEAFIKMGKPELIKPYRKNGDYMKNDPRIMKFGRFIRKTSLDELPQLFNILKGDISLIGPRALLPNELKTYGDRSLILSVKSGLTGLAQVSGRRDISFEERRSLDIYYVKNWTIAMDLQIFFKTIAAVFKGEGAK